MTGLLGSPAWIKAAIAASLLLAGCHNDKPCEQRIDPAPCPGALEREGGGASSTQTSTWFVLKVIDGDTIVVDGNHPLAGVTLNFEVIVMEVRDASAEELEHGHVHGPHGHHHD